MVMSRCTNQTLSGLWVLHLFCLVNILQIGPVPISQVNQSILPYSKKSLVTKMCCYVNPLDKSNQMSLRKERKGKEDPAFFRWITLQKCICYTCINVFLQNTKESLDNILSTVQLYTGFVPNVIFNCNYVNLCESIEKEADSDCSNGGFFLSLISQILHCLSSPHPVAAHLIVIIARC